MYVRARGIRGGRPDDVPAGRVMVPVMRSTIPVRLPPLAMRGVHSSCFTRGVHGASTTARRKEGQAGKAQGISRGVTRRSLALMHTGMDLDAVNIKVSFPLRALIYPSGDIKNVWIAHALDLDLVTQGASPQDAERMLEAATDELVMFRITNGLAPIELRPAPEEVWRLADEASGESLSREPVPVWIGVAKADISPLSKPRASAQRSTYTSNRPPSLNAGAV